MPKRPKTAKSGNRRRHSTQKLCSVTTRLSRTYCIDYILSKLPRISSAGPWLTAPPRPGGGCGGGGGDPSAPATAQHAPAAGTGSQRGGGDSEWQWRKCQRQWWQPARLTEPLAPVAPVGRPEPHRRPGGAGVGCHWPSVSATPGRWATVALSVALPASLGVCASGTVPPAARAAVQCVTVV